MVKFAERFTKLYDILEERIIKAGFIEAGIVYKNILGIYKRESRQ